MSVDTLPAVARPRSGRAWAWAALFALALLVVAVVGQAVEGIGALWPVVLAAVAVLVGGPVVAWFALTTRAAWKRVLSLAGAAGLLAALAVALVALTLAQLGGLLVIVVAGAAFRAAAKRAVPGVAGAGSRREGPAPAHPWLLVNPWSGGGTAGRVGLTAAAEAAGFDVHVLAAGEDVAALARGAVDAGADVLAAAGGDGTLAQVAAVALEFDLPFVCVPAGTRNHFARDVGLDRDDPLVALCAIYGPERRLDAAFVGDRLFLNNVSLGAYADVVASPRYRRHKLDTSRVVVRRLVRGEQESLDVRVGDGAGRVVEHVQVLQVANNGYQLHSLRRLGARDRLDGGVLQISALSARTGSALAGLAARAAVGHLASAPAWAQWEAPALTVDSPRPVLAAGVDGEPVTLAAPLVFRVAPKALRVLVPPAQSPWARARRRRQAVPAIWRLATATAPRQRSSSS